MDASTGGSSGSGASGIVGELPGTRRQIMVGGLLLAAGALAFARRPTFNQNYLGDAKLEDLVPHRLGAWNFETSSGLVLPPADQLRDKLYSQLLTRVYSNDDTSVMLLIAYSGAQDGVIQVHRPEVCYPASGYRLSENSAFALPLATGIDVPSRFISAASETRDEQLAYWTRIGNGFPTRWVEQREVVAKENLGGVIPDGVLVRISVIGESDPRKVIESFAQSLYRSVPERMRHVLVGART